ncbi:metal ABC transporter permease [Azotosporobacter soli]|uniref:metal ABC transporter permease n=1 Tax=Azotosporobacter soli TaxID=3055040 RepID=UPI0031FE8CDE
MEFFQYDFLQRALVAGILIALACPLIGNFVVLRRQSMIGDGLGHIAFAGVTGGYMVGWYPAFGAFLLTLAGALGIEWLRRRHRNLADMGLAVFFYAGIALAIIFSTMTRMPSAGLLNFLFGSILTVTNTDLALISACTCVVMLLMYRYTQSLLLMSLDEDVAKVAGVPIDKINLVFSVLTAVVVVSGMMVVGILLVSALMIVPVAAAHALGLGFRRTIAASVLISLASVFIGLTAAFQFNIAPGGTIVMTGVALYIAASLWGRIGRSKLKNSGKA